MDLTGLIKEIQNILGKSNMNNGKTVFTENENLNIFGTIIKSIILGDLEEFDMSKLTEEYYSIDKECRKDVDNINETDFRNKDMINMVIFLKKLLTVYLRYKLIQFLSIRSSCYQYLLRIYKFNNFKNLLEHIYKQNDNVHKKLLYVEKVFEVFTTKSSP